MKPCERCKDRWTCWGPCPRLEMFVLKTGSIPEPPSDTPCGAGIWKSTAPFRNYHICELPKGHEGPHRCANCDFRWS